MFPIIAMLEEVEAAKAIVAEARRQVGAEEVEIGVMIEVPSAVLRMIDRLMPQSLPEGISVK